MSHRLPLLTIVMLLCGCTTATEPAEPSAPISALPDYRQWFEETKACSGLKGSFDDLNFHVVSGDRFTCASGQCVGMWVAPNHIYIAQPYLRHEMVVRHEMLHALIGQPGHPDPPFAKGCNLTWDSWKAGSGTSSTPIPSTGGLLD